MTVDSNIAVVVAALIALGHLEEGQYETWQETVDDQRGRTAIVFGGRTAHSQEELDFLVQARYNELIAEATIVEEVAAPPPFPFLIPGFSPATNHLELESENAALKARIIALEEAQQKAVLPPDFMQVEDDSDVLKQNEALWSEVARLHAQFQRLERQRELEAMRKDDLVALARSLGVEKASDLKQAELVEAILSLPVESESNAETV